MTRDEALREGRLWGEAAARMALEFVDGDPDAAALDVAREALQTMLRQVVDRLTIQDGYAAGAAFGEAAAFAIDGALAAPGRRTGESSRPAR